MMALRYLLFAVRPSTVWCQGYTYNCLIHLCAVLGRPEEAVTVLRMMYEDGSPESKPDSYTYTALLRVVTKSQKWDLLPRIFRGMQRSKIEMDTLVWCSLISVADKAGRLDVATEYYEASKAHRSGGKADLLICNHYLVALVHHGPLSAVLTAYRSMLDDGFQPDVYSFNALFSAMADAGASLYAVQDLISEMAKWNIKMNTHLGTSMIHAYKRCPEMIHGDPRMASLLMERAHDLLNELVSQRQANHQTFTAVASMHAKLGDIKGVQEVLHLMDTQGVTADGLAFYHIGKSCEDGGLIELSNFFYEKAESRGVQVTDKMQKIKSRKKNKSKEPAALHWMKY
ncbi:hypothetical protein CEUSTIGMA_g9498.t1 [Chlamydomonas eustigma]|uniref:Pentacotripeptide-repeat region of PRORP domain-containing protein n=1 Tax=Chlamydomonas eustigma TaxID=1157962 RepID=A0A250XH02_9CHLO|nr:hypothetical protein CEUSTIGMA_g9498.t1 [Chlamydomonas eustigma]|eukprot:GAX82070.1 hypothetical protein CEUSTIGMA_g9498.t1 [Chlamydomonas eustigma]